LFVDATVFTSLTIIGTSLGSVRLGWALAAVVALVMSAPGLVPWDLNVLYHRAVGPWFGAVSAGCALGAVVTYARSGATGCMLRGRGMTQPMVAQRCGLR
jgi:hypothetical protein